MTIISKFLAFLLHFSAHEALPVRAIANERQLAHIGKLEIHQGHRYTSLDSP